MQIIQLNRRFVEWDDKGVQPRRPCTGALRAKLPTGRAPRSSPARRMSDLGAVNAWGNQALSPTGLALLSYLI